MARAFGLFVVLPSLEVLSVVSTQYKSVLDAIRANSKTFLFVDEAMQLRVTSVRVNLVLGEKRGPGQEMRLIKTCGAFITMRPRSMSQGGRGMRPVPCRGTPAMLDARSFLRTSRFAGAASATSAAFGHLWM